MRTCQLVIRGELSALALSALGGVLESRHERGTTLVTVAVRDQAGIHGLVAHLDDLGLTLLELTQPDPGPGGSGGAAG